MLYYLVACLLAIAGFVGGAYAGDKYIARHQSTSQCRQTAAMLLIGALICICVHFVCRHRQFELPADIALAAMLFCTGAMLELAKAVSERRRA